MIGAVIVIVAVIVLGFIWCFCKMSSIQSRMEEESYRLRTVEKRNKRNEYMRKWREKNREHYNQYHREYMKKGKSNER